MLQLLDEGPGDKVSSDRWALEAEMHSTCVVTFKLLNYEKSGENDGFLSRGLLSLSLTRFGLLFF